MGRPKGSKNGIRKMLHKTCETCQSPFDVEPFQSNARFCSRACQSKWHAQEMFRQTERQCKVCGSAFMARPASKKIYCSQQCASKEHSAKVRKPFKKTEFATNTCSQCGKVFIARVALDQKFCSKKCGSKSYERRIELECQMCHKIYTRRAKKIAQKYCSRTCRTIGIGKTESYLEKKMASMLSFAGINAIPQYPFGPFTLDFAIPDLHIAIECDGDYWHSLPSGIARDHRKDRYLSVSGWHILRFSETLINADLTSCLVQIQRLVSLQSQPS